MGWFSRNINKIRGIVGVVALIFPGALALGAIAEGLALLNYKFDDKEVSPADAAILDPWALKFQAFYDRLVKVIGNSQSAADLNGVIGYCDTMLSQYSMDSFGLTKEGVQARDNFIYATFEALNKGIAAQAQVLAINTSDRSWMEIETSDFNDPIYAGNLIMTTIESQFYGIHVNVPPPAAPPVYTAPAPQYGQENPMFSTNLQPHNYVDAPGKVPTFPNPTGQNTAPVQVPLYALDDDFEQQQQPQNEAAEKTVFQKYKLPIILITAAIAVKTLFSNNN